MVKKEVVGKAEPKRFRAEFKQRALLRAAKGWVLTVARDLTLGPAQVYAW